MDTRNDSLIIRHTFMKSIIERDDGKKKQTLAHRAAKSHLCR